MGSRGLIRLHGLCTKGDEPERWRKKPFRIYRDGPLWEPPEEQVAKHDPSHLTAEYGLQKNTHAETGGRACWEREPNGSVSLSFALLHRVPLLCSALLCSACRRSRERLELEDLLNRLTMERRDIGDTMYFCVQHAEAYLEVGGRFSARGRRSSVLQPARVLTALARGRWWSALYNRSACWRRPCP